MISLKQRIARFLVRHIFSRCGARIEICADAQVRTLAFYPLRGASFNLGSQSIFAGRLSIDKAGAAVRIGSRTYFGRSHLVAAKSIEIGDDVLVSWGVTILDHQSHSLRFDERKDDVVKWLKGDKDWSHVPVAQVRIGDKVWIGFNATIMPGITIGEGAVVAACSVVTKDVEPWTVVAGNPARVVRHLDDARGLDDSLRNEAMNAPHPQAEKPEGGT